jgi:hypothetical protein
LKKVCLDHGGSAFFCAKHCARARAHALAHAHAHALAHAHAHVRVHTQVDAVAAGMINESDVDTALVRIYTLAVQLGLLDGKDDGGAGTGVGPFSKLGPRDVDTPAHRQASSVTRDGCGC